MAERKPAEREPKIFKNWDPYVRQRQAMASAVIFKNHGWYEWEVGHANLYGILLWHYATKKQTSFKYSKVLERLGYRRTHNYRLLKAIVEKELLQREGNGHYSLALSGIQVIEKVLSLIKGLDIIGNEAGVNQKSQDTASSERIMRKNAKN
jgi:hypothetical protein